MSDTWRAASGLTVQRPSLPNDPTAAYDSAVPDAKYSDSVYPAAVRFVDVPLRRKIPLPPVIGPLKTAADPVAADEPFAGRAPAQAGRIPTKPPTNTTDTTNALRRITKELPAQRLRQFRGPAFDSTLCTFSVRTHLDAVHKCQQTCRADQCRTVRDWQGLPTGKFRVTAESDGESLRFGGRRFGIVGSALSATCGV